MTTAALVFVSFAFVYVYVFLHCTYSSGSRCGTTSLVRLECQSGRMPMDAHGSKGFYNVKNSIFSRKTALLICCVVHLDMPFGGAGQKFPMGGLGFEGQPGIGASPGSLMGNEMVMYPIYDKTSFFYSMWTVLILLLLQTLFKSKDQWVKQDLRSWKDYSPHISCWFLFQIFFFLPDALLLANHSLNSPKP